MFTSLKKVPSLVQPYSVTSNMAHPVEFNIDFPEECPQLGAGQPAKLTRRHQPVQTHPDPHCDGLHRGHPDREHSRHLLRHDFFARRPRTAALTGNPLPSPAERHGLPGPGQPQPQRLPGVVPGHRDGVGDVAGVGAVGAVAPVQGDVCAVVEGEHGVGAAGDGAGAEVGVVGVADAPLAGQVVAVGVGAAAAAARVGVDGVVQAARDGANAPAVPGEVMDS